MDARAEPAGVGAGLLQGAATRVRTRPRGAVRVYFESSLFIKLWLGLFVAPHASVTLIERLDGLTSAPDESAPAAANGDLSVVKGYRVDWADHASSWPLCSAPSRTHRGLLLFLAATETIAAVALAGGLSTRSPSASLLLAVMPAASYAFVALFVASYRAVSYDFDDDGASHGRGRGGAGGGGADPANVDDARFRDPGIRTSTRTSCLVAASAVVAGLVHGLQGPVQSAVLSKATVFSEAASGMAPWAAVLGCAANFMCMAGLTWLMGGVAIQLAHLNQRVKNFGARIERSVVDSPSLCGWLRERDALQAIVTTQLADATAACVAPLALVVVLLAANIAGIAAEARGAGAHITGSAEFGLAIADTLILAPYILVYIHNCDKVRKRMEEHASVLARVRMQWTLRHFRIGTPSDAANAGGQPISNRELWQGLQEVGDRVEALSAAIASSVGVTIETEENGEASATATATATGDVSAAGAARAPSAAAGRNVGDETLGNMSSLLRAAVPTRRSKRRAGDVADRGLDAADTPTFAPGDGDLALMGAALDVLRSPSLPVKLFGVRIGGKASLWGVLLSLATASGHLLSALLLPRHGP